MEAERRYKVTILGAMGKVLDIGTECCKSNDFNYLLSFMRDVYQSQDNEAYIKNLPKIVDRYSNQEYDIFDLAPVETSQKKY